MISTHPTTAPALRERLHRALDDYERAYAQPGRADDFRAALAGKPDLDGATLERLLFRVASAADLTEACELHRRDLGTRMVDGLSEAAHAFWFEALEEVTA
jgi:hypothetical protein